MIVYQIPPVIAALREAASRAQEATRNELLGDDADLGIRVEYDKDARTVSVSDNGIGMNRDEIVEHLGTIAKSGTAAFLENLTGDQQKDSQLIGQFGVGFYSSFIVADMVTVITRKAGSDATEGVRWTSDGGGEYSLDDVEKASHGTEVILHLKEAEKEFLSDWTLKSLVSRYSDHIGFPIRMQEKGEDDEPQWKDINKASAL